MNDQTRRENSEYWKNVWQEEEFAGYEHIQKEVRSKSACGYWTFICSMTHQAGVA
jgi:hypothetical protein